ncbi:MAG: YqhA family protein [Geothrix sp.]|nr:YqhA family protein [Acidobacteriota bacterium]
MLKRMVEGSRYLVVIGVISSLIASLAVFVWGLVKTGVVVLGLLRTGGADPLTVVRLIELMDKFLIAVGLYIFAVGLYELFIGDLDLPDWLVIHDLHDIKSRLSQILILFMAVTFLEHLVEWKEPLATLYFAVAITLVMGALIAFNRVVGKE